VPGAAGLFFDAQPDAADSLMVRFLAEREARAKTQGTAEKN
jgi:hypothetical protein